jgi:hypothetical protein
VKSCSHLNKKIRSLDLCVMCFLPFCFDVAGSEVSFILRFRFGRCKLRACKQLAFSFEFSCRRRVCSSIFSCHSSCPLLCSFFPGRIHFARSPAPITASKQLLFPISFFLVVFYSLRWSLPVFAASVLVLPRSRVRSGGVFRLRVQGAPPRFSFLLFVNAETFVICFSATADLLSLSCSCR